MNEDMISDLLESNDPTNWYLVYNCLLSLKDEIKDVENELFIKFLINHSNPSPDTKSKIIIFINDNFKNVFYSELYRTYTKTNNKSSLSTLKSIYKKDKRWK